MNSNDPNAYQVGGNHYGGGEYQHWDFVGDHLYDRYWEAAITKYICRYRDKNGADDLEKASHFCTKMIQRHAAGVLNPLPDHSHAEYAVFNAALQTIAKLYKLTNAEVLIIQDLRVWRIPEDLRTISVKLRSIASAYRHAQAMPSYVNQD